MELQLWRLSNNSTLIGQLAGIRRDLLIFQVFISIIGIAGNIILVVSIYYSPHLKTFEIFLLGLAASNLVAILNVDIYDMIMLFSSGSSTLYFKPCSAVTFFKVSGVTATMYFTVLICIFRYQKIRDAGSRGNKPVFLDNILTAWAVSGAGVLLAVFLATPTFFIKQDMSNLTSYSGCPPDIFQCPKGVCPILQNIYKFIFLFVLTLLPFLVVTGSSTLIIRILMHQQRSLESQAVEPADQVHHDHDDHHHHHHLRNFHRSTFAVLAAMGICQVTWTMYLTLYLAFDPYTFQLWQETEFFITTIYATVSPYVYGIGNNLFSPKHCAK